jgi:hypothetical protein
MSEPAKDEDELAHRVADTLREYVPHINFHGEAIRAIAAIRKAGWAVVPVALMEQAVDELEENANGSYPYRDAYPKEQRRYERDMELPRAIRATLEVKR